MVDQTLIDCHLKKKPKTTVPKPPVAFPNGGAKVGEISEKTGPKSH
jgi:hypothetical protein